MSDFIDVNAKLEDIIHDSRTEELFKDFLEDLHKEGWTYFDLHYNFDIKCIDKKLYYTITLPLTQEHHFTICKDIAEDNLTNVSRSVDTLLEWLMYKLKLKATLTTDGTDDLDIFDQDHNLKKSNRRAISKSTDTWAAGFMYKIYFD